MSEGIDIRRMLERVVADVFGEDIDVEYSRIPKAQHYFRARITSFCGTPTDVGLEASEEVYEAFIFDVDPRGPLIVLDFDYDEDECQKEAVLRDLARVLLAYVRGEGRVEHRPSLILRRPRASYVVDIDGRKFVLGRSWSFLPSA